MHDRRFIFPHSITCSISVGVYGNRVAIENNNLETIEELVLRFILNKHGRRASPEELRHRGKVQGLHVRATIDRLNILFNIFSGTMHVDQSKYIVTNEGK